MDWNQAVKTVSPHIVKIETPNGYGTGFLVFYNHDKTWCGIATAAHVVSHADDWQELIKIRTQSAAPRLLQSNERVIFIDNETDSAILLFFKGDLQLPEVPITLLPVGEALSVGLDAGWLGYPVIQQFTLCFFSGTVSARLEHRKAYLIDGVAINGVSGGPVIHCPTSDQIQIVGCISAYHANRATGETLPGLLIAQDVSHFHGVAESVKTIDEANAKKREFEEAQKAKEGTASQENTGLDPPKAAPSEGNQTPAPPNPPTPGT